MIQEKSVHHTERPQPLSHPMGEGGVGISPARRGSEAAAPVESFIDKAEVGRRLAMKPRTIDDWMKRGLLPFYKMGRAVRFKWSEVEAHMQANCRVCRRNPAK